MILDFLKIHKKLIFGLYFIVFVIIQMLSVFSLLYTYILLGGFVIFTLILYIYCKYIVTSKFSLNFEIILIINQVIICIEFIRFLIDKNKFKSSSEIVILAICFSVVGILLSEKFNIQGKLFK